MQRSRGRENNVIFNTIFIALFLLAIGVTIYNLYAPIPEPYSEKELSSISDEEMDAFYDPAGHPVAAYKIKSDDLMSRIMNDK